MTRYEGATMTVHGDECEKRHQDIGRAMGEQSLVLWLRRGTVYSRCKLWTEVTFGRALELDFLCDIET